MKEFLQTVTPIAMIGMIVAIVGAGLLYFLALRIGASRDELRKLRSVLERDPGPSHLADARRRWPEVSEIAEKLQVGEMRRLAHRDEMKLSQSFESGKAASRVCIGAAVVLGILFAVGTFWKPQ
ncbi:MAG: hypothetical protein HKUEN07_07190 [Rhodocyclaceae bacterium]|nr:MAG: hypothetical protein HKUEN07_07190 [Rhodocyclaceae bacterium]